MILNFESIETEKLKFFGDLSFYLFVRIHENGLLELSELKLLQKGFVSDEKNAIWFLKRLIF